MSVPDAAKIAAIDWSGRATGETARIWRAEHEGGRVVSLRDGLTREGICEWVLRLASADPRLVVGLDFAFSLPSWFLRARALGSAYELWALVEREGERWLRECRAPFWGRKGRPAPNDADERRFRRTELELRSYGAAPKSAFQVNGAGSVGTGSLRGMPVLRRLRDNGFSIWPFDEPGWPRVVEIYPRLLTGKVRKSSAVARRAYLRERPRLRARLGTGVARTCVAGDDAFDAAVSAAAMGAHAGQLAALGHEQSYALEGRIWHPPVTDQGAPDVRRGLRQPPSPGSGPAA